MNPKEYRLRSIKAVREFDLNLMPGEMPNNGTVPERIWVDLDENGFHDLPIIGDDTQQGEQSEED